ncbi:MAG: Rrf2 family transcriptional regulator [Blautia obeum]
MKYSTKLSDTIHILIFIALGDDEQLSSTKIAESIKTNPAYVRQLMAILKNAGIVVNTQGHANAALAKSADKINMYDIYRAVEGDK